MLNPDCREANDESEDAGDDCKNVSEVQHIVRFKRDGLQVLTSYCQRAVDIVPPASMYAIVADQDQGSRSKAYL